MQCLHTKGLVWGPYKKTDKCKTQFSFKGSSASAKYTIQDLDSLLTRERIFVGSKQVTRLFRTAPNDLWTKGINTAAFDLPLSPEKKLGIKNKVVELNPGYDVDKLQHMVAWDIKRYNNTNLPAVIGALEGKERFSEKLGIRVLDLCIRMPGSGWAVPEALRNFVEVIARATEYERAINPNFDDYYAYITVDQNKVEPGFSQRRFGAHGDGYITQETIGSRHGEVLADNIYVVSDSLPTVFYQSPFGIEDLDSSDLPGVLERFRKLAEHAPVVRYESYSLLRMTPYDIHTPAINTTSEAVVRTFVKVQFSRQRLNRSINTRNLVQDETGIPKLSYQDWEWVVRNPNVRNVRNAVIIKSKDAVLPTPHYRNLDLSKVSASGGTKMSAVPEARYVLEVPAMEGSHIVIHNLIDGENLKVPVDGSGVILVKIPEEHIPTLHMIAQMIFANGYTRDAFSKFFSAHKKYCQSNGIVPDCYNSSAVYVWGTGESAANLVAYPKDYEFQTVMPSGKIVGLLRRQGEVTAYGVKGPVKAPSIVDGHMRFAPSDGIVIMRNHGHASLMRFSDAQKTYLLQDGSPLVNLEQLEPFSE